MAVAAALLLVIGYQTYQSLSIKDPTRVLPAVDVLGVDVDDVLPEFVEGVLGDAGLPGSGRS